MEHHWIGACLNDPPSNDKFDLLSISTLRILFRVDGSYQVGLGHLMRCHALSQALNLHGSDNSHLIKITFLVNAETALYCRQLSAFTADICELPNELSTENELRYLVSFADKQKFDAIVLDGYQFSTQYRKTLRTTGSFLVCFDDTNSLDCLHADMVINGALDAIHLDYAKTARNALLCLGDCYRVMRQEFCNLARNDIQNRANLTVVFGGSDPANLTLPTLKLLETLKFDGKVSVITGQAFIKLAALRRFLETSSLNLEHFHNCQNMAAQFSHSRLVISAAGGSQFELQATGTPSILIVVADNQFAATRQAEKQGWCYMIDGRDGLDYEGLQQLIPQLWTDQETLRMMCNIAYDTADNQGAGRVAKRLVNRIYKR